MAANFGNTASYITFPHNSLYDDLITLSVIVTVQFDAFNAAGTENTLITKYDGATEPSGWHFLYFGNAADHYLRLLRKFSTTSGIWSVNSLTLSTGVKYQLGFTYDKSSVSNNPAMYVNGVSQTVTRTTAPVGTAASESSFPIVLSDLFTGYTLHGTMYQALVYNRILSATEIADTYASRLAIPTNYGLVFAPLLVGAKNVQTFDGAVLVAGNTLVDSINGAIGTPNGSPIGKGDTVLTFQGVN
jgi:hypothetical protein